MSGLWLPGPHCSTACPPEGAAPMLSAVCLAPVFKLAGWSGLPTNTGLDGSAVSCLWARVFMGLRSLWVLPASTTSQAVNSLCGPCRGSCGFCSSCSLGVVTGQLASRHVFQPVQRRIENARPASGGKEPGAFQASPRRSIHGEGGGSRPTGWWGAGRVTLTLWLGWVC